MLQIAHPSLFRKEGEARTNFFLCMPLYCFDKKHNLTKICPDEYVLITHVIKSRREELGSPESAPILSFIAYVTVHLYS